MPLLGIGLASTTAGTRDTSESARQMAMLTPEYQSVHGCRADAARDASHSRMPIIEGLAPVRMPIAAAPAARRYFEQGISLLYGFEYAKAERSFAAASEADANCAMCLFGQALAMGPNINSGPMASERAAAARSLLRRLLAMPRPAPLERSLADALLRRYAPDGPAAQKAVHAQAFAEAMGEIARAHRGNDFVQVLAAEAAMNVLPWDYWEEGGVTPKAWGARAMRLLQAVLDRSPRHPQALHLYIHLNEASAEPGRAEAAADRLRDLAPASAHLQHMPGHIYYGVGRFREAVSVNRNAIRADEAMAVRLGESPRFYNYFRHHTHFIVSAAEQIGDREAGLAAARELELAIAPAVAARRPDYQRMLATALQARLQLSELEELLAVPAPAEELPALRLVWLAVRADALARAGRIGEAAAELERFARSNAAAATHEHLQPVVEMSFNMATARLRQAQGRTEDALRIYALAEAAEASAGYWEPPLWSQPVAVSAGAALLRAGNTSAAQAAFRRALARRPGSAWALYGLAEAQRAAGARRAAGRTAARFARVWAGGSGVIHLSRL